MIAAHPETLAEGGNAHLFVFILQADTVFVTDGEGGSVRGILVLDTKLECGKSPPGLPSCFHLTAEGNKTVTVKEA